MKKALLFFLSITLGFLAADSQYCYPQGNQLSYGTNNTWIGYVYDNMDFTNYKGYVTEGSTGNPNFDQQFGGATVTYATHGCSIQTETFSVRYKLSKTFTAGSYAFQVGGDDGYRLSLDGGATWVIDNWALHSYTTSNYTVMLNGTYNMVLEYYENQVDNRVSFSVNAVSSCGTENTSVYGTNNSWNGYLYDGTNFDSYAGMTHEGTANDPSFTQNFGGSNTYYATSGCSIQTETFSARYRLTKTFTAGTYTFTVGGDDGVRFSIDGGATWLINDWSYHSYRTSTATVTLNGTYKLVLEFFEGGGDNYLSFLVQSNSTLPLTLLGFEAKEGTNKTNLAWEISSDSDPDQFNIEKSTNGTSFSTIGTVAGTAGLRSANGFTYAFTDFMMTPGRNIYRLKMTDLNGKITYSKTVLINRDNNADNGIKIFPTVTSTNQVNLNTNQRLNDAQILVMDYTGKIVSRQYPGTIQANETITVKIGNTVPASGLYIVKIMDHQTIISSQKIIVN